MSAVANLGRIVPSIGSLFPKYQIPTVQTSAGSSIGNFFSNLFKSAPKTAPKVAIPTASKVGSGTIKSVFSKTNIVSGSALGIVSALSFSQGGQNLVSTAGQGVSDVTNLGKSVNDLFNKNPFIPIGLLILGGLVVVSVIKK